MVKSLRASGERELATEIATLRRPSLAEWALNRVALDQPDSVRSLLDAIDAVRTAQQSALAGQGRSQVREANEQRRRATEDVARRAAGVLEAEGRPAEGQLPAVNEVLRRVGSSAAVAEQLVSGRLGGAPAVDDDPFGGFDAGAFAPPTKEPARSQAVPDAKQRRAHERALAAAEDTVAHARRSLIRADRELARARDALAEADEARSAAQAALAEADQRCAVAAASQQDAMAVQERRTAEVAEAQDALAAIEAEAPG